MTADIPKLLTERAASDALGVSIDTLRRERKRQRIGYTIIGGRVRYTQDHLAAYIERGSFPPCPANEPTIPGRSVTTGSPSAPTAAPGAEHGLIGQPTRLAAHRSAQTIFGKPNSPSRNGSR